MKKETNKEWTALCQTCKWSGKRSQDQAIAQQGVESHLKTHPRHKVRLLVTGGQDRNTPASDGYYLKKETGSQ
jgi:hypothetical protein